MAFDYLNKYLNIINILFASTFLMLDGCMDASTRGGEAADHIVISGTPTWSNGIGELMNKKCANCHQVPRLATSPATVPADLDLRYEKLSSSTRAAEEVVAAMKLGILKHTLNYGTNGSVTIRTMPLSFSTPLYSDEITSLETWANGMISAEQSGTSPALSGSASADGELLYKRHCQGCHGQYAQGGLVKRSLRGYTATQMANYIQNIASSHPMYNWPMLLTYANLCTPSGAPTTCNNTQLDWIAAYLATL